MLRLTSALEPLSGIHQISNVVKHIVLGLYVSAKSDAIAAPDQLDYKLKSRLFLDALLIASHRTVRRIPKMPLFIPKCLPHPSQHLFYIVQFVHRGMYQNWKSTIEFASIDKLFDVGQFTNFSRINVCK